MFSLLTIVSSALFIFYGFFCLISEKMEAEFVRFGLGQFRIMTGILEILGGTGLLIGYYGNQLAYLISSGGLALLMLLGTLVRLRIKDSLTQTLPALGLLLINAYIFLKLTHLL